MVNPKTIKGKLIKFQDGQEVVIEITINEDGKMTSLVNGMVGPGCEELTKFLNELGQVVMDEATPEFYQQASEVVYANC